MGVYRVKTLSWCSENVSLFFCFPQREQKNAAMTTLEGPKVYGWGKKGGGGKEGAE